MKKTNISRLLTVFCLLLGFTLGGCDTIPGMSSMGPKFKPLDSEVAAMAAPDPGPAAKSLYCQVGHGSARFGKAWLEFPDTGFRLTPQSRLNIDLHPKKTDGTATFQAMFDLDGQRMIFCPVKGGDPDERVSCASIYALDDDLQAGIKRTFDVPDEIAGASISCAYEQSHLQKL